MNKIKVRDSVRAYNLCYPLDSISCALIEERGNKLRKPIKRVKVAISMPGYRIEGFISVPEGQRPSDFLNARRFRFVAITDSKVYDWQGEFLEDKDFLAVNKERISWIAEM
ncbi:MAG: hypothetical protein JW734_04835 [Candidatus Omnitrophica bacterium]|nr:hypothetical protein [Candidatus Omnitrophota bacterium]